MLVLLNKKAYNIDSYYYGFKGWMTFYYAINTGLNMTYNKLSLVFMWLIHVDRIPKVYSFRLYGFQNVKLLMNATYLYI